MFQLFRRDQIDSIKWDECINQSEQKIIYGLSWYLDIVSPDWFAYIKEENEKYTSVFPFAANKKFWIKYIYQPPLTQQLGLFSIGSGKMKNEEDIKFILTNLSKNFHYIDYNLNADNRHCFTEINKFKVRYKTTHHLRLNKDYQTIYNAYSENHKRNLKKSISSNLILKDSTNISLLISLFKREGKDPKTKKQVYSILHSLFAEASSRNMCRLIFSENPNGEIQAAALFLFYQNMIIYLFGVSTFQGKQNGAMSMVFNQVIKTNSGIQDKILDFEGSDIESIARFYRGFGGEPVKYISINANTLPFILKHLKNRTKN